MTKRFNEFGAMIDSNFNKHSENMQKKMNEIARDMNSQCVRVSGSKHFDYVQVVSDKFEGFSEAFADIMKNESEMLSLLKRDLYERAGVPEYWIVDADENVVEQLVQVGFLARAAAGVREALDSTDDLGRAIDPLDRFLDQDLALLRRLTEQLVILGRAVPASNPLERVLPWDRS